MQIRGVLPEQLGHLQRTAAAHHINLTDFQSLEQSLRSLRGLVGNCYQALRDFQPALRDQHFVVPQPHIGENALFLCESQLLGFQHLLIDDGSIERQLVAAYKFLADVDTLLLRLSTTADLLTGVT